MNQRSKSDAAPGEIPQATDTTETFASLFAESVKGEKRHRRVRHQIGDRVEGRLSSLGQTVAVIDLPDGVEGTLDIIELRDEAGQITARVGDLVSARVASIGQKAGSLTLRRSPMRGGDTRAGLEQAVATGLPVDGLVTAVNKGGLEVTVAGVRAFCPISQIDLRPVVDPSVYIGQKLAFRITKFEEDRRGQNVVLSRRALLEEEQRERAAVTRDKLTVGAVLSGVVTGLKDFGAFVDLGGIDGLLPASEIGFQRGTRPSDVLSIGQPVTVQILRIEERSAQPKSDSRGDGKSDKKGRSGTQITLSLKSLERDPWDDAAAALPAGTTLRGKVMRAEAFGAFIEVAPGVEGLIHISELGAGRHLQHAREVAKPGTELEVTVLAIDRERRRISLGLASDEERVDDEGRAAVIRAAAPDRAAQTAKSGGMGTFGELLKEKLSPRK
jgi:small subunit ribosomal protein S1